jgi:hypothetical protein
LSNLPLKDPAPADDEPRPGHIRKPVGWSMIVIAVLVAVSAGLVWRRDGINGVTDILTHDLSLFGGILPRVLAGCLLGAFLADRRRYPGGPVIGFSIGAVAMKAGGGPPQVIAYVIAWALFAFQRMYCGKSRSCRPASSGSVPRCPCRFRSWLPPSRWQSGSRKAAESPEIGSVDTRNVII